MPRDPYYAYQWPGGKWVVAKHTRTGSRVMAWDMSEAFARRVAKLLNEAESE